MADGIEHYIKKVEDMIDHFAHFAAYLEEIAANLRLGFPPSDDLPAKVTRCLEAYKALHSQVYPFVGVEEFSLPEALPEVLDLLLLARQRTREGTLAQALRVLDKVLQLTHTGEPDFSALEEVQAKAAALAAKIREGEERSWEEAVALAQGEHPFAKLLLMVDGTNGLDDMEWEAARKAVENSFGSAIATAAARNRLVTAALPVDSSTENEEQAAPSFSQEVSIGEMTEGGTDSASQAFGDGVASGTDVLGAELETGVLAPGEHIEVQEGSEPSEVAVSVWRLISEGRFGLAFHLARALEKYRPELEVPPAKLLEALALAPHVSRSDGEIALALESAYSGLGSAPEDLAIQLLLWAATIRPSLIAPQTGSTGLLRSVTWIAGLPKLSELTNVITAVSERLRGLSPGALKGVKGLAAWEVQYGQLRQEIEHWLAQAPNMTMVYAPATDVWKAWNRQGGPIYQLLKEIRASDTGRAEEVRERIKHLCDPHNLHKLILETDRKELGRHRGKEIHARALRQLEARTREVVNLARRWMQLIELHPEQPDYVRSQVENLRNQLNRLHTMVNSELRDWADDGLSVALRVAAGCALSALEDFRALFDPESPVPSEEPEPRHLLSAELLLSPDIDLTEGWEPQQMGEYLLKALMDLAEQEPSWERGFEAHLQRGDLEGAERILVYLEAERNPMAEALRARWLRALEEYRRALADDLAATSREVETALAYGFITESERADHNAAIVECERRLDEIRRFDMDRKVLKEIRDKLIERKLAKTEVARRELEQLGLSPEDPVYQRIRAAIDGGDVLAANEYLERAKAGEPLVEAYGELRDPFEEFFPKRAEEITQFLDGSTNPDGTPKREVSPPGNKLIVKMVKERRNFAGLRLRDVPGAQTDQAADMLEAWYSIKKTQLVNKREILRILRGLGFNPREINVGQAGERTEVEVNTDPISDREVCPVPTFGSLAEGLYRILCVWGRPSEEELVNLVGETTQRQRATIVFYFGRLSEKRRIDLARMCRERRRTFLVVDETLMIFLTAERGLRLSTLFRCTLPFTFCEPYVTTSGFVPPEMFYGRNAELDSLVDLRQGRSFVYGGRQLGKTALLREAARRFHNPESGRLAIWIDLKVEGVGSERGPEEVWRVIYSKFRKLGVVSSEIAEPNPNVRGRIERFTEAVESWLNANPERGILLLLDEADRFLEQDGRKEFMESSRLKGLMDRASRRFRVVFAGLHNVLRTTEQSNHPLAHLGDPINVGPLLQNGEWDEARALVERPLESLGYKFQSKDLVTRILAQTNYYPSLIQLYCAQLLRQLTNPRAVAVDYRSGPRYTITEHHIEEAYQNQDLRDAIRQRFQLTLQLDPRYEVIAHLIAYEFLVEARSAAEGLSTQEIRREAVKWWPEGFQRTSDREFRVLLEEMEGLGVLRAIESNRYTLRNPNILLLMGTQGEIESVLVKEREAPQAFEPHVFRARKRYAEDPRRHPLTFQQESALREGGNGVTLIFGTMAAGLADLLHFLRERVEREYLVVLEGITSRVEFQRRLEGDVIRERREGGTTLVVIPPVVPWGEAWVADAIERIGRLRAPEKVARVVFIADPQTAWNLIPSLPELQKKGAQHLILQPWDDAFLRQWLEDVGLPNDKEVRLQIASVTGNWPYLLYILHERSREDPQLRRHLTALEQEFKAGRAEYFWAAFGLENEARETLTFLAEHANAQGMLSAEDLELLSELGDTPAERLKRCLSWAELLMLAVSPDQNNWQFDPVVNRLLRSTLPTS